LEKVEEGGTVGKKGGGEKKKSRRIENEVVMLCGKRMLCTYVCNI
jgi:hypothetical protein